MDNKFYFNSRTDTIAELELVKEFALANGAADAVITRNWSEGGAGAVELAAAVLTACNSTTSKFSYLYDLNSSIEDKILKIATNMYGAGSIEYHQQVKDKIQLYKQQVRDVGISANTLN